MKATINKASSQFTLLLLIILAIAINVYFRLDPLFLRALKYTSRAEVYQRVEKTLDKYISEAYPTIPPEAKKNFSKAISRRYFRENQAEINKNISEELKIQKQYFQDDSGFTYLLEEDPYRWMRRVENVLNTGHAGGRIVKGEEWDDLKNAPFGGKIEPIKFHYYAGAYFYKFLHSINSRLSLMNCLSFFPLFLSAIMVLVIFGFCAAFGISRWSAFLASLAIGISRFLLARSSFGWFDTDLYNIIFPLVTVMVLAFALKAANFKRGIYLLLAALTIGIYSSFWSVWWMSFFITILTLLFYQLEFVLYEQEGSFIKRIKGPLLFLVSFIFFSYLFVFLISGFSAVKSSLTEPLSYLKLGRGLTINGFWPNIGFSIHELRKPKAEDIIIMCGGIVVYAGITGLLLLSLLRKKFLAGSRRFFFFFTFTWLVCGMVLVNYGLRFLIFLILPLGLAFAVFWDIISYFLLTGQPKINFMRNASINTKKVILAALFFIMALPVINTARKISMLPIVNDTWWQMLNNIKEKTPENAVINAPWDYADYVMTISKRQTVYDGSWQYTPVSYWIPRALLAQSEEEALGILRMLDCGSNSAFDELNSVIRDKKATFQLINKLILIDKKEAADLLGQYITDNAKIDKILKLLYCAPPAYLLIDDSLISIKIITRPANWDFERSDLWQKFNTLKEKDFILYTQLKSGYSEKKARELYATLKIMDKTDALDWIAPSGHNIYLWRSRAEMEDENLIIFDNGIVFDKKTFKTYFNDNFSSQMINPGDLVTLGNLIAPGNLIIATNEGITENVNKEGDARYTVFLEKTENSKYTASLLDSAFARSLLFKLYFLEGRSLKHFKLVTNEKKNATNIYLYKIIW